MVFPFFRGHPQVLAGRRSFWNRPAWPAYSFVHSSEDPLLQLARHGTQSVLPLAWSSMHDGQFPLSYHVQNRDSYALLACQRNRLSRYSSIAVNMSPGIRHKHIQKPCSLSANHLIHPLREIISKTCRKRKVPGNIWMDILTFDTPLLVGIQLRLALVLIAILRDGQAGHVCESRKKLVRVRNLQSGWEGASLIS